jgi:hypothetical protein
VAADNNALVVIEAVTAFLVLPPVPSLNLPDAGRSYDNFLASSSNIMSSFLEDLPSWCVSRKDAAPAPKAQSFVTRADQSPLRRFKCFDIRCGVLAGKGFKRHLKGIKHLLHLETRCPIPGCPEKKTGVELVEHVMFKHIGVQVTKANLTQEIRDVAAGRVPDVARPYCFVCSYQAARSSR